MRAVIIKECEFDNCAQCPHVLIKPSQHSPIADDYYCGNTPDEKLIASYVEWEDQLPKYPPECCPLRGEQQ